MYFILSLSPLKLFNEVVKFGTASRLLFEDRLTFTQLTLRAVFAAVGTTGIVVELDLSEWLGLGSASLNTVVAGLADQSGMGISVLCFEDERYSQRE